MPRGHYKRIKRKLAESADGTLREISVGELTWKQLREENQALKDRIAMLNKELEVLRNDLNTSTTHADRLERIIDKLTQYD